MNQQLYRRFDEPVNRVNTECIKWDNRKNFGNADALPMWVADMDFRTADGIRAIRPCDGASSSSSRRRRGRARCPDNSRKRRVPRGR